MENLTVEHMLPESFGGDELFCLPSGLVCSQCNQYFGREVERPALDSYPFNHARTFAGIPTKKEKLPVLPSSAGDITTDADGSLVFRIFNDEIWERASSGQSVVILVNRCVDPVPVCRLILKMGIELVARQDPGLARSPAYDEARRFARAPPRGATWWFGLIDYQIYAGAHSDPEIEANGGISLYLRELAPGIPAVGLDVPAFTLFSPLRPAVRPPIFGCNPCPGEEYYDCQV